jgi:ADP-ribose pyrophosphatase YjhB (NUDIX family)
VAEGRVRVSPNEPRRPRRRAQAPNCIPMKAPKKNQWLEWTRRLQAIAQTGLAYAHDPYDAERYAAVRDIVAEMIAAGSGADLATIKDVISKDAGYATPKIDVRGVVFRENKILLVRERADGLWTLPGGWADVNESPTESVVREVREEAGFEVRCRKLLAVFDRGKHPHEPPFLFHIYKLFIQCEIAGGSGTTGSETDQVSFFAESELPALSISRVTPWQVKRMFEHLRDPNLAADLD